MRKILILGATSAIAQATARLFAARGASLYLVARKAEPLDAVKADLTTRGASRVAGEVLDLADCAQHEALVDRAEAALGGLDGVLLAHGVLGDQAQCERSWDEAAKVLSTNFTSAVSLLSVVANRFEARKEGTIVAISSVAGDRGRQSNYFYGASKGGLSIFLQGLRHRLHRSNVRVVDVKPGFVDTPMTAHVEKNALFATPEQVARGIVRAAYAGRAVAYVPGFWWLVMFVIRNVPNAIFHRTKL